MEEGVGGPDLAGQEIVQRKDLHGPIEFQSFIVPGLSEKHVDGVFLGESREQCWRRAARSTPRGLLTNNINF